MNFVAIEIEFSIHGCKGSEVWVMMSHVPRTGDLIDLENVDNEQYAGKFRVGVVTWQAGFADGSCGAEITLVPV